MFVLGDSYDANHLPQLLYEVNDFHFQGMDVLNITQNNEYYLNIHFPQI